MNEVRSDERVELSEEEKATMKGLVRSSAPAALRRRSLLDEVGPAPSAREPTSVAVASRELEQPVLREYRERDPGPLCHSGGPLMAFWEYQERDLASQQHLGGRLMAFWEYQERDLASQQHLGGPLMAFREYQERDLASRRHLGGHLMAFWEYQERDPGPPALAWLATDGVAGVLGVSWRLTTNLCDLSPQGKKRREAGR